IEVNNAAKPPDIELADFPYDSELQAELCRILDGDGYRVTPRYVVGAHPVDIVVQGAGTTRVGILCDGGRTVHAEELGSILEHQMILERLGWKLIRIRASEYFRDPKKELERLRRRLGARGIKPIAPDAPVPKPKPKKGKPAEPKPTRLHER